ncbi:hypothetical protein [Coraliomargarita parva]|uniref:hypothetical protein n=1 Tax=Coraliomargarita parva TaxID=3014050 RepID=UPI0022B3E8E0|nr:hypothetical protein [Coraliomargarita parva]
MNYHEAVTFREKCCNSDAYDIQDESGGYTAVYDLQDADEHGNVKYSDLRVEMSAIRAGKLLRIEKAGHDLAHAAANILMALENGLGSIANPKQLRESLEAFRAS